MTLLQRIRAEQAADTERQREQVLRRLKWAAPNGISQRDLERRLDLPAGLAGSTLRELEERGEAQRRDDAWYYIKGLGRPRPAAERAAAGHTPADAALASDASTDDAAPAGGTEGRASEPAPDTREKQAPVAPVAAPAREAQDRAPASETRPAPPGRTSTARRGGPGETEAPARLYGRASATPRGDQVVEALVRAGAGGSTVRDLANDLGISRGRVSNALTKLKRAGRARTNGLTRTRCRWYASTVPVDVEPPGVVAAPSHGGGPGVSVSESVSDQEAPDAVATAAAGPAPAAASAALLEGAPPDDATLDDLDLTVRSYNVLKSAGYRTAGLPEDPRPTSESLGAFLSRAVPYDPTPADDAPAGPPSPPAVVVLDVIDEPPPPEGDVWWLEIQRRLEDHAAAEAELELVLLHLDQALEQERCLAPRGSVAAEIQRAVRSRLLRLREDLADRCHRT